VIVESADCEITAKSHYHGSINFVSHFEQLDSNGLNNLIYETYYTESTSDLLSSTITTPVIGGTLKNHLVDYKSIITKH
jgi:hypothetical protein